MATESAIDHPLHAGEHPERHEHSDLSVTGLAIVFIVGAISVGVVLVICYFTFWFFQETRTHAEVPRTSIVNEPIVTPEPRIQGIPGYHTNLDWQDLNKMMQHVDWVLASYGKTSEPGYVHIPIDQAMTLALKDGTYKVRPQPANHGGGNGAR